MSESLRSNCAIRFRVFRISGFGLRVSGFGLRMSGFGFRASGVRFRTSNFGIRVSGFGFRVSSFGFRVSDLGFRVSGFGFRVSGLRSLGQEKRVSISCVACEIGPRSVAARTLPESVRTFCSSRTTGSNPSTLEQSLCPSALKRSKFKIKQISRPDKLSLPWVGAFVTDLTDWLSFARQQECSNPVSDAALEATQGQICGFSSQFLFKCHLEEVASVGN